MTIGHATPWSLPAWEVLFPDGETVRNISGVYYRDLALEVSES